MDDWKFIILGIITGLIISLVLAKIFIGGLNAVIVGFLVAGIIVGYLTGGDNENVAINGVIVGFLGGIIFILVGTVMNNFIYNPQASAAMFTMFIAGGFLVGMITGVICGIVSAIGGIIGGYIKSKT